MSGGILPVICIGDRPMLSMNASGRMAMNPGNEAGPARIASFRAIVWVLGGVFLMTMGADLASGAESAREGRASATSGSAEPPGGEVTAGKSLEERIAELEALVVKLRAELEALRSATTGGSAEDAGSKAIVELERRIDILAQEVEKLRIGEAAAPPAAKEPI